jgi:putative membrane protein
MITKFMPTVVTLALTLVMAAQNPQDKNQNPPDKNNSNDQLSSSDHSFLTALIQEDISEIELAKMALQKSSDPQVKQYAQTKILDADPEMRHGADQIARQCGLTPPSEPNARQKQVQGELSNKTGKLFDNSYMIYEAMQQNSDLELVNAELKSTKNSALKSYVTKEKTPVQQAAASAIDVNKKVASELATYKQPDAGGGTGQQR